MLNAKQCRAAKPDYLLLLHRWSGLIAAPFLMLSVALAIGLTHTGLLNRLSELIYDSQPIPKITLSEKIQPGSWDQALKLANLVTGKQAKVITSRDDNTVEVQSFMQHTHAPQVMKHDPHTQVVIDTRTMSIVRIQDKRTSLSSKAHAIHAFRLFDRDYLSVAFISAVGLSLLLISGGLMAWRDRKFISGYAKPLIRHIRLGQSTALLLIIIVVTTLDFEFSFMSSSGSPSSHPIPETKFDTPFHPGSIDQARELVRQVTGALPLGVYIRNNGDDVKFSEAGDGIGGKSVWMNINTMTVSRITDWRNDRQALVFILHDGRWLGGMNLLNINDLVALILLWLVMNGLSLHAVRGRQIAQP